MQNPQKVGEFNLFNGQNSHRVRSFAIKNNLGYIADGHRGLSIIKEAK